jgi:homocysteine S-methyltransferase
MGERPAGLLWTAAMLLDRPEVLTAAHRRYVEAGADVVITASYQASEPGFVAAGLSAVDARRVLATTTDVARASGASMVAASVGPYGAYLANGSEYNGRYGVEWQVVEDYHREKLAILVDSGADLIAIETIPLADEALLIAEILEELGAPPAWFSFGFADETQTYGLDTVDKAVLSIAGYADLVAIGMNCTHPRYVDSLLQSMSELVSGIPLIVYPNHGREWDAVARCWTGDSMSISGVETVKRWIDLGARFIGGCCGVDPLGIADLVVARDSLST